MYHRKWGRRIKFSIISVSMFVFTVHRDHFGENGMCIVAITIVLKKVVVLSVLNNGSMS